MSLYPMSKDIQTLLAAKKFPLRVHYGPERMHREAYPENVVIIERDREADDTIGPPKGVQPNPRKVNARGLASVATIYARSARAGAHVGDHETLCEKFVDAVLAALSNWAKASRAVHIPITSARYLSAAERLQVAREHAPGVEAPKIEAWPGAVYRIKFLVPRALLDLDYAGEGLPTAELEGFASRTDVYAPGSDNVSGTGCGGP